MNTQEFPQRIYTVDENGALWVRIPENENAVIVNTFTKCEECRYLVIRLTEGPSEAGWVLRDLEKEKEKELSGLHSVNPLTLEYITFLLKEKFKGPYFWTEDFEEAKKLSEERFNKTYPTGESWDVVRYWDNVERVVVNEKPMLREEALEMENRLKSRIAPGSLYTVRVEKH